MLFTFMQMYFLFMHARYTRQTTDYTNYRLHTLQTTQTIDYRDYRLQTTQITDYTHYRLRTRKTTHTTDYTVHPYRLHRLHTLQTTHTIDYTHYRLHTHYRQQTTHSVGDSACHSTLFFSNFWLKTFYIIFNTIYISPNTCGSNESKSHDQSSNMIYSTLHIYMYNEGI